jgi:hypothetical protein
MWKLCFISLCCVLVSPVVLRIEHNGFHDFVVLCVHFLRCLKWLLYGHENPTFTASSFMSLVSTSLDRVCHMVSITDAYGHILGFLDRSQYFFFQVAPQLYSRG